MLWAARGRTCIWTGICYFLTGRLYCI